MAADFPTPGWQTVSRTIGLVIVLALLIVYLFGWPRDTATTLAFLTIASGLIGLPSGVQLASRSKRSR